MNIFNTERSDIREIKKNPLVKTGSVVALSKVKTTVNNSKDQHKLIVEKQPTKETTGRHITVNLEPIINHIEKHIKSKIPQWMIKLLIMEEDRLLDLKQNININHFIDYYNKRNLEYQSIYFKDVDPFVCDDNIAVALKKFKKAYDTVLLHNNIWYSENDTLYFDYTLTCQLSQTTKVYPSYKTDFKMINLSVVFLCGVIFKIAQKYGRYQPTMIWSKEKEKWYDEKVKKWYERDITYNVLTLHFTCFNISVKNTINDYLAYYKFHKFEFLTEPNFTTTLKTTLFQNMDYNIDHSIDDKLYPYNCFEHNNNLFLHKYLIDYSIAKSNYKNKEYELALNIKLQSTIEKYKDKLDSDDFNSLLGEHLFKKLTYLWMCGIKTEYKKTTDGSVVIIYKGSLEETYPFKNNVDYYIDKYNILTLEEDKELKIYYYDRPIKYKQKLIYN